MYMLRSRMSGLAPSEQCSVVEELLRILDACSFGLCHKIQMTYLHKVYF